MHDPFMNSTIESSLRRRNLSRISLIRSDMDIELNKVSFGDTRFGSFEDELRSIIIGIASD
jgi:hypothetical protein